MDKNIDANNNDNIVSLDNSNIDWNQYAIICGSSHPELEQQISSYLGTSMTEVEIRNFHNSEISAKIERNIRNKDVFIIQSPCKNSDKSVNDFIMELLLLCNSCALSSAKSISCIIPCFPYARSDKKDESRICIGARLVCDLLETCNVSRICSFDLHSGQIQGFTKKPFDNLYAQPLLSQVIKKLYLSESEKSDCILVSPDAGSNKRVNSYASELKIPFIKFDKQRDHTQVSVIHSISLITQGIDPRNKIAIIIDDIVDTMGTMVSVVNELGKYGIRKAVIVATHGILSSDAIDKINNCHLIESVIITNTLPLNKKMEKCKKIIKVNIHKMIGDVIKCWITGDTISDMFKSMELPLFGNDGVIHETNKNEINFFY